MPRKKNIQPLPLESIHYDDGLILEIRDEATREIGRGKDKKYYAEDFRINEFGKIVDKILTLPPIKAKIFLNMLEGKRTTSELSRHMQLDGAIQEERSLWEHAKGIQKEWQILMSALEITHTPEAEEIKKKLHTIRST